jgi:hypothetical protein
MSEPSRTVRRLRVALVGVSMLCALLVLVTIAAVVYWRLYLEQPTPGPFERRPYVVRLGSTSAQLKWRIDGPVELRAIGPDGSSFTAQDGRFDGLEPGVRYGWTAAVDGLTRASGSFRTAPSDPDAPVTFGVLGDYGSGNDHEWAVGRVLDSMSPDFLVGAGDNSYLVAAGPLLGRNIFRPLANVMSGAPLWTTMGEHDLVWRGGADVTEALDLPGDRGRYAMRYGPVQLVVLGLEADTEATAFARGVLQRTTAPVRFVVTHRPVQPGNPILALLRRYDVAAILAGHLHRYERRVVGGVLEFVVGTGGEGPGNLEFTKASPDAVKSLLDYGALRVDVEGGAVRSYTFVDERGRVLDRVAP